MIDKKTQIIRYIVSRPKAVLSRYFGILTEDLVKLELHLRKHTYSELIQYYKTIEKVTY